MFDEERTFKEDKRGSNSLEDVHRRNQLLAEATRQRMYHAKVSS